MSDDDHFLLDPPPGFQGLDPHGRFALYTRHLPHWRLPGATYFVTIRLADSLPQEKLVSLRLLRKSSELKAHANAERWLDEGLGSCVLAQAPIRGIVEEALHHFDQERYDLGAYVVMPNHLHLIVRPLHEPLERILQSRKRTTAREINRLLQSNGSLWQEESFDRIIRDASHLWRALQYLGDNPRKANLAPGQYARWVRPGWRELGWGFLDL